MPENTSIYLFNFKCLGCLLSILKENTLKGSEFPTLGFI